MGTKRDTAVGSKRHGTRRAVSISLAAAFLVVGCGHSGQGATHSDKAADVEVLNGALAGELTAVDAYAQGLAVLHGALAVVGREFRGQDQAHIDALTKAIRGLGGETEAEAGELESPGPRSQAEALTLAYEEENAALAASLDAAPRLQTPAPRALAAALAASHAQHLVVLRQGLGTGLAASVPEAFEPGDLPAPAIPAGGGRARGEGADSAQQPGEKG